MLSGICRIFVADLLPVIKWVTKVTNRTTNGETERTYTHTQETACQRERQPLSGYILQWEA